MRVSHTVFSTKNLSRSDRRNLGLARLACLALVCFVAVSASHAQTYTVVASFDGSNGELPQVPLVQGADGNYYGTTPLGGAALADGTVFKVSPTGQLKAIYSFCSQPNCTDGWEPQVGLTLGVNGNLYGTAYAGGANTERCDGAGCGSIFEITPAGKLTTLYSFCPQQKTCPDGALPLGGLVLASNGNFYGTASKGGSHRQGAVFEITPAGKYTTLYSFCSLAHCTDGAYPATGLVQGSDGNLYGTTYNGGALECAFNHDTSGCGTIFKITLSGQLTTLHSFGTDAGLLQEPLVQGSNGNFYGTSINGGKSPCGAYGCGTVFEITSSGDFTTLYSFCMQQDCPDGAYPWAGLALATDGNLYGSTQTGGGGASGTIFAITPAGALTTVYNFGGVAGGEGPQAGMIQGTDGKLYGSTNSGGAHNLGAIFSLDIGAAPFVGMVPAGGSVGAKVLILGNNLADATSVTFNGTSATFTAVSNTSIKATVPNGATSGSVVVTTPAGSLKSNVVFQVGG